MLRLGDAVDLLRVGREEAGAPHRFLAHEHGRHDRLEAVRAEAVERELHERELQADGVALEVGEAAAGGARATLHVDHVERGAEVEVVGVPPSTMRGSPSRRSSVPSSSPPVGHVVLHEVGQREQQLVELGRRARSSRPRARPCGRPARAPRPSRPRRPRRAAWPRRSPSTRSCARRAARRARCSRARRCSSSSRTCDEVDARAAAAQHLLDDFGGLADEADVQHA